MGVLGRTQQFGEFVREALRLQEFEIVEFAELADDGIARAHHQIGIRRHRPRVVLQFADEALVQAPEAGLFRLEQAEIVDKKLPQRNAQPGNQGILDLREAPHQQREPAARQTIGQKEVETLGRTEFGERFRRHHAAYALRETAES